MSNVYKVLDNIRKRGRGNDPRTAMTDTLYGHGQNEAVNTVLLNRELQGYTFIVKPQCNMKKSNIANDRRFYDVLTTKIMSIPRYIRGILDPRLASGLKETFKSPLLNPEDPFITILTNNTKTLTGWPDLTIDTTTTSEGIRKQQYTYIDGMLDYYQPFELNLTVANIREDPVLKLIFYWLQYGANVHEGIFAPYDDMIVNTELDYTTRIYRLTMSEDNRFVKMIAATGAAFPLNLPMGKFFDLDSNTHHNQSLKEVTIRWRCMGAFYNENFMIRDFNETVGMFNPAIRDYLDGKETNLIKLTPEQITKIKFRSAPIIDPDTRELLWLVDKDLFEDEEEKEDDA